MGQGSRSPVPGASPRVPRQRADGYPIQNMAPENFVAKKGVCLIINDHCVYRHTSPEGKVYIGTTRQDPEKRWRGGLGYADNLHFLADILDFGWRNFAHDILETGLTAEEAYAREAELIREYRSTDPEFGYNLSRGQRTRNSVTQTRKGVEVVSTAKPIICVETGELFASTNLIADLLGVDCSSFRKQMRRNQRCRGLHYRYATPEEVADDR